MTSPEPLDLDVSIVLPVHNEAGHLQAEIDRIAAAMNESRYAWELIVVDDGSTDDSAAIAAADPRTRLIRCPRNRGAGAARRVGTEAAHGDVVVWSDADMTYPNDEIPALVDALGDADQVIGARTSEQGSMRVLRTPAKWLIRQLAIYLTQTPIPDLNTGFRAFRRDVALQYVHQLPNGFSCVTTITMAFLMNGYAVRFVPIEYRPRAGESKFHWLSDTRRYGMQVIRMMLSYDPLRVMLPIAAVLGIVFAGKLTYDLIDKDFRPAANTLLLGFATLQVLAVGLLADLIVRVTGSTTRLRPADIVDEGTDPPGSAQRAQ